MLHKILLPGMIFHLTIACLVSVADESGQSPQGSQPVASYGQLRQQFSTPDHAKWGEVPLWWWEGAKMNRVEVTRQLEMLATKGVKSVCPIQRSPARCNPASFTPEWWDMFSFVAEECKRLGMTLWAYDQVGYGQYGWLEKAAAKTKDARTSRLKFLTADGTGTFRLELPQGKVLGIRAYPLLAGTPDDQHSIDLSGHQFVHENGARFFVWTPPMSKNPEGEPYHAQWKVAISVAVPELIFTLSDQAADTFIDMLYGEVERRLGPDAMGKTFAGMFQDEHPPTPRDVVTDRLLELFQKRNGYPLARAIPALYFDVGPLTPKYRIDYLDTYLAIDESCYWKRVYDWTAERGILTSHDNWGRQNIERQSEGYIDYFRTQRWFSAPGYDDAGTHPIDGRNYYDAKIAASIARLYGRPRVWAEVFHSSGWGRTTEQTLAWLSTNYAFGANLYDEHGLYYSVQAGTWEHAAPDPHWRQPYWQYYQTLSDWVARMSHIMAQGTHVVDVAVHYPVTGLLAGDPQGKKKIDYNHYMRISKAIFEAGIDNDILDDDSILAATIEDGRLVVAGNGYQAVVIGPEKIIRLSVLNKLRAFVEQGGTLLFSGQIPTYSVEYGLGNSKVIDSIRAMLSHDTTGGFGKAAATGQDLEGGYCGRVSSEPDQVVEQVRKRIESDFVSDEGKFHVAHRRIGQVDVYLVQNVLDSDGQLKASFRVDGVPEWWNPFTGDVRPVDRFVRAEGRTRVEDQLEGNMAQLLVFRPGDLRASEGGFERSEPAMEIKHLDNHWEFSTIPTRDNRWGEFRWPPSEEKIGPEVRTFRYRIEVPGTNGVAQGWQQPSFDLSTWTQARAGIGPHWLLLEKLPLSGTRALRQLLKAEPQFGLDAEVTLGRKSHKLQPIEFSKTIGRAKPMPWGGHSGYPDGAIDQNFIELPEGRKFLFTRIRSAKAQRLGLRVALHNSKARLWVSGVEQPFEDAVGNLPLVKGINPVLLELPDGGHGMLYVQADPPSVATLEDAANSRVVPKLEEAKWIRDASLGAGFVRKIFHLDQLPSDARVVVTGYTGYRLMINGTYVFEDIGPWAQWTHPESVNISSYLKQGENVIAAWIQVLHGQNVRAIAEQKGFALALAAENRDGSSWQLVSDGSWKGSAEEHAGWDRPGFDESGWQPVELLAPMGSGPWGAELLAHVGSASEPRRPLAIDLVSPYLTCFDEVPDIAYDVLPESDNAIGWVRFDAPPGLAQLKLPTRAEARVWVDGIEVPVEGSQLGPEEDSMAGPLQVGPLLATVAHPPTGMSKVAVRLQMERGEYGGAIFSKPIGLELRSGIIEPGLWADWGLPNYSGIGVYRQEVALTAGEANQITVLDLGQVLVAAEVLVNGKSAGIRLARPFHYNLTGMLRPGDNIIEVHVANTIAPHYTQTNQSTNLGPTNSGLLGPVVLRQTGKKLRNTEPPNPHLSSKQPQHKKVRGQTL